MPKSGKTKRNNKKNNGRRSMFWAIKMFVTTLVISIIFSIISQETFSTSTSLLLPLSTIFIIILVGVIFDIIGIAVASTSEVPFVSMSAKKIRGAREALSLIKNADLVSNFCNDVVGDVCGIISGAAGSMLVLKMVSIGIKSNILGIVISSLIAAFTVGGKALGKGLAIGRSQEIIYGVGYLLSIFTTKDFKQKKNNVMAKRKEAQR